ncbi:DNA polymerase III subunit delta [Facklamia hominis]|uniref:DNA polymerase III subunit delta n=1 Tax=Facklamia hominis TaxID=178214 RepID=UPI002889CC08|nr:DNA polymerase III subunit delta [Facklamia hominis]
MGYQEAIQAINQNDIQAIYTLLGKEYFLIQEFRETLMKSVERYYSDLDISVLDYREVTMDQVLDEAESFSFLAELRLVMVEEADFISTNPQKKLTIAEEKRLQAYLKDPNPGTCLVFLMPYEKVDKRRKLTQQIQKYSQFIEVLALDERELRRYLKDYIKAASLNVTKEAFEELLTRTNFQLSQTMAEIKKLAQYAQNNETINLEVVKNLVTRSLESNIFELTDAILRRHFVEAIQIYQDLILMKNDPLALQALIISQFRLILQVQILYEAGQNQGEMAKSLNVHPYRVKLAMNYATSMDRRVLEKLYRSLIEADFFIKTGKAQADTSFYLILSQLAHS